MRPRFGWILVLLVVSLTGTVRADLAGDVRAVLADDFLKRAEVGVKIVQLGQMREQDRVLFESGSDKLLIPASNLKIVSTAFALETLSPEFKFRTVLLQKGSTLALVGDGDPALGDSQFVQHAAGEYVSPASVFSRWGSALAMRGQKQFDELVVDDSVFDTELINPNWSPDQHHLAYSPQLSGLNLNGNCLDVFLAPAGGNVTVRIEPGTPYATIVNQLVAGSDHAVSLLRKAGTNQITLRGQVNGPNRTKPLRVTIHEPTLFTGSTALFSLEHAGVEIKKPLRVDRTVRRSFLEQGDKSGWSVLAVNETPLLPVLAWTNKESDNLFAECLARRATAKSQADPVSRADATRAMMAFVVQTGADPESIRADDGCGLSKENQITASAFCSVLSYMHHGTHREDFRATLAIGGVDGTLDDRFSGELKGRVFAKSGYVNRVFTLSGYMKTRAGQWIAFSFLINDVPDGRAKRIHERILKAVDQNVE
jgi:serine-type D-Ala-D-Ala carboxypeptidase/endopeptidase (penicillin-binding protein 4)